MFVAPCVGFSNPLVEGESGIANYLVEHTNDLGRGGEGKGGRGVVGIPLFANKNVLVSWFLGFLVAWFLGFLVSKLLVFFVFVVS